MSRQEATLRILLIADVHANWEALLALQRAEQKPDAVLFVGDAVGYGPDPVNCVRWLLANTTLAVRGNHDAAIHRSHREGTSFGAPSELEHAAQEVIAYSRRLLSEHETDTIGQWPLSASITLGGTHFHLVHGTPLNPLSGELNSATASTAELLSLFQDTPADLIVVGHTHMPSIRKFDGRWIVNPGSLGQPRYGVPDATYAVWEDGQLQIKHLHYDHDSVVNRLRLLPLSAETTDCLAKIIEQGML